MTFSQMTFLCLWLNVYREISFVLFLVLLCGYNVSIVYYASSMIALALAFMIILVDDCLIINDTSTGVTLSIVHATTDLEHRHMALISRLSCFATRHFDNTYKDFTYNDFPSNINKCDIIYMLFIYCYKKSHLKVQSVTSNVMISNVTCIKCYRNCHDKECRLF
jgi:hypothetical protein